MKEGWLVSGLEARAGIRLMHVQVFFVYLFVSHSQFWEICGGKVT